MPGSFYKSDDEVTFFRILIADCYCFHSLAQLYSGSAFAYAHRPDQVHRTALLYGGNAGYKGKL